MMAQRSPVEETAASVACLWRPGQETALTQCTAPAIARTARLRLQTARFPGSRSNVDRLVAELRAGTRTSISAGGGSENRIAHARRAGAVGAAGRSAQADSRRSGQWISESQNGEDVGNQIIDVEARLSNARNTERRLLDLLQRRTGELEQVLAAEREIARVREEIERFVAQPQGARRPCDLLHR